MQFGRLLRSTVLVVSAIGLAGALPAQSDPDLALVTRTLPNGLEVVVYPDHSVPLVTVEVAVKMGSVYETARDNGLAHLYEHLFFRSNRATVNKEDYLRGIGGKGISYNGSTHEEFANFYLTGLKEHLPTLVHFLRDSVMYPAFLPDEVNNEVNVVIGEADRIRANPNTWLTERAAALLFPVNPTFKVPLGLEPVITAATPAQMHAMHDQRVIPTNAVLVVSGDCDPAEVFRLAEEYFGTWARGAENTPTPDPGPPLAHSAADIRESTAESNVIIDFSWRGPSVGSDTGATYAADVLSYVLNQPNSRFQKALVDSGLTTGVNCGYYTQRYVGTISFILVTTPEKAREAVRVFKQELGQFTAPDYFSDQEMENAKAGLKANELFDRENPVEYAHSLSFWWATAGMPYLLGQQQANRGTGREDIGRYLGRYVLRHPYVAVALVPSGVPADKALTMETLLTP